jgi:hypothetical protein
MRKWQNQLFKKEKFEACEKIEKPTHGGRARQLSTTIFLTGVKYSTVFYLIKQRKQHFEFSAHSKCPINDRNNDPSKSASSSLSQNYKGGVFS